MKHDLLNKLIRTVLFEQEVKQKKSVAYNIKSPEEKTAELRSNVRKIVIKPSTNQQFLYATRNGAVNVFRIIIIPEFKLRKNILINSADIIDIVKKNIDQTQAVGLDSEFDNGDFAYVVSNNQSLTSARLVYNVWILNYRKLKELADLINSKEQNTKIKKLGSLSKYTWFTAGKSIPVLQYKDAANWIALLREKAESLGIRLLNSDGISILPDLTKMNKKEDTAMTSDSDTVEITDSNADRYNMLYGTMIFRGTAKKVVDAYGNEKYIPIDGNIILSTEQGTKQEFTGKFKDGWPLNGIFKNFDKQDNLQWIWDGELKRIDLGEKGISIQLDKKHGKFVKLDTYIKYPIKNVEYNNQHYYVKELSEYQNTLYIRQYDTKGWVTEWKTIDKADFELWKTQAIPDSPFPEISADNVTDPSILEKLNKKDKEVKDKETDVITTIEYPYVYKWKQINNEPITLYKLDDDSENVYYTDTFNWFSMPLIDTENFIKNPKTAARPTVSNVTDAVIIEKLAKLVPAKEQPKQEKPKQEKPKQENPKQEKPKSEILFKSGQNVQLTVATVDVYELRSGRYIKQTTRSNSSIKNIKFKFYSKNKYYSYVEFQYKPGGELEYESYWVLTSKIKAK